jgi:hypothetical protein
MSSILLLLIIKTMSLLPIWTHSAKATQALGSWGRIEDFLVSNDATTALQKQLLWERKKVKQ